MVRKVISAIAVGFVLFASGSATATTINFASTPTNTTYLSSGLLLGSSDGGYVIGSCGAGSVGCLGNVSPIFSGWLDFTFVAPNTTNQASTNMVSFIMCRSCDGRPSFADVFDSSGAFLAQIDMNVSSLDVADHTFSFAAADIGRVRVTLGFDAVESITFGDAAAIPEPATLVLVSLGLLGLGVSRRKPQG